MVDRSGKVTVYLCGPITGRKDWRGGWRREATQSLAGIVNIIDPTRGGADLVRRSEDPATRGLSVERLIHGRRVVSRDRFDVQRTDIVLACFLGATSVSIGSVGEIFWADALHKPVMIVREEDNPHNHDMLNDIAGWIFPDLDSAIRQIVAIVEWRVDLSPCILRSNTCQRPCACL